MALLGFRESFEDLSARRIFLGAGEFPVKSNAILFAKKVIGVPLEVVLCRLHVETMFITNRMSPALAAAAAG